MIAMQDKEDLFFKTFYCGPNGNLTHQHSAGKSSMTPYVIDSVPLNHSTQQSPHHHLFPRGGAAKSGISSRVLDRWIMSRVPGITCDGCAYYFSGNDDSHTCHYDGWMCIKEEGEDDGMTYREYVIAKISEESEAGFIGTAIPVIGWVVIVYCFGLHYPISYLLSKRWSQWTNAFTASISMSSALGWG